MANYKGLVVVAGQVRQIADGDEIIVGAALRSVNSTFTISSSAWQSTVALAVDLTAAAADTAGKNLTIRSGAGGAAVAAPGGVGGTLLIAGAIGGAGAVAQAAGAGAPLTLNSGAAGAEGGGGGGAAGGVVTIAPGASTGAIAGAAVNITGGAGAGAGNGGNVVIRGGAGAAAGLVDIPAGTSLALGAVACGATVDAANLTALTDGSNADALHTHLLLTTDVGVAATAGQILAAGEPVCFNNDVGSPRVFLADANGAAPLANAVGVAAAAAVDEAAVTVVTAGERLIPTAVWDAEPVVGDVGSKVYLSANVGKLALAPPATGTILRMGFVTKGGVGVSTMAISIGEGILL